ncbi:cystatin-B-like [Rhinatrema bivittatum]|uniref:cystatin-B-like n=1 Tax=Rhinatrema bivittatum TaxID=194408 RepID=UPI001126CE46|nr:cystatin-B-like [Rhinatrema bivittatum]
MQAGGQHLVGGLGAEHLADAKTQALLDQVRPQYEAKDGKKPNCFKLISYKKQIVAGTNYFCKVQTGPNEYSHVRFYETLPHDGQKLTLTDYQTCKTKHDEIIYF